MGFGQAISSGFSKFFVWRGRASRSEFWWWILFSILALIVALIIDQAFGFKIYSVSTDYTGAGAETLVTYGKVGIVYPVVAIILFFPTLAVTVRRLHDTNHSGWWWWLQLLNFLCAIGTIILVLAFYIRESDPVENRYGPPPVTV